MCTLNTYVIRKKLSYCFVFFWFRFPPRKTVTEVATLSMARAKTRPTRTAVSIQQSASSSARLHSSLFIGAARREVGVSQIIPTGQFSNASKAGRRDRWCLFLSAPNTYGFNTQYQRVFEMTTRRRDLFVRSIMRSIRSFWVGNVILFYFTSNAKWQIHGRTTRPSVPS